MADALLIRLTAWTAFALYLLGEATQRSHPKMAFRLSAAGLASLIVHILIAFHWRYNWSHTAALQDTAAQTAALTGFQSGSGLYLNYLFAFVWMTALIRSRNRPTQARPGTFDWAIRGFFLFMFSNATFIFVANPAKWLGLAGCLVLLVAWYSAWKSRL